MTRINLFTTTFLLIVLSGCGDDLCGSSSVAVQNAKSLTPAQLQVMRGDFRKIVGAGRMVYDGKEGREIPVSYDFIKIRSIRVQRSSVAFVYLETCSMDSKVVIFMSYKENEDDTITLQWGEGPEPHGGKQILWPKA